MGSTNPNDGLRRQSRALPPSPVGEERDGGGDREVDRRKPVFTTKYHTVWASLWLRWWRICPQCRRPGFDLGVGKIPWRRKWPPTSVFLPGKSHGQSSVVRLQRVGHNLATDISHLSICQITYVKLLVFTDLMSSRCSGIVSLQFTTVWKLSHLLLTGILFLEAS